jgi:hypothetical protein
MILQAYCVSLRAVNGVTAEYSSNHIRTKLEILIYSAISDEIKIYSKVGED